MSEISYSEYWKEIGDLAQMIAEEEMGSAHNDRDAAEEAINDSRLHETIDGHQWVIYNAYNLDVIRHSNNEEYYTDNFGGEELAIMMREGGLDRVHNVIAFFCMYADVNDKIEEALDEFESNLEGIDE